MSEDDLPAVVAGWLVDGEDVSDPLEAVIAQYIALDTTQWRERSAAIAATIRSEFVIAARRPDAEPRRTRPGWYQRVERRWAAARFGFPVEPVRHEVHIASDGSEWTYAMNAAGEWDKTAYGPDEV